LRKQWEEIMEVCNKDQCGQFPGKTIVFAMTQKHAERLWGVFDEMYPQYRGEMTQVITSDTERVRDGSCGDGLITKIKLWQMIGRGTRSNETCLFPDRLPDGRKTGFKIIDFWENKFDRDAEEVVPQTVPVLVRIFNTRLNSARLLLRDQSSEDFKRVAADLRNQISQIPLDSFAVKKVFPEVEEAWQDSFWQFLTQASLNF
jgi:type I restriction enzyme R subunit